MNKLIILNHKMNLEYDEVIPYIDRLNQLEIQNNIIVLPSNIYLESFMNHCTWGVGAQNVSEKLDGNYTGEVSTLQLKSMGIEYVMVGHYERKKYFHETNEQIRAKLNACIDANLVPILCFGETGEDQDIFQSLEELLQDISNIRFIIFAYEPLKAEKNQSIDKIQEQVEMIYDYLYHKYQTIPNIIYGGGILQKDIKEILAMDKLNGILVGKVSSHIEKVEKIFSKY